MTKTVELANATDAEGAERHSARTALPPVSDALIAGGVGLLARLAIVAWAASRFSPVEDGRFYHTIAGRIAAGQGYTWVWPDGVVTYAAHYPVGYPALVGALYALFGPRPLAVMLFNALAGAASVVAVHRIAATVSNRVGALSAALAVALHPALVFYTPALMTEGVTAAFLSLLAWLALACSLGSGRSFISRIVLLGALFGLVTLLRPQLLILAPAFGALAATRTRTRLFGAAVVTIVAVAVCLPWTLRNCSKMDGCTFVSANAGWNLLIGVSEGANGSFIAIEGARVPDECRSVFGEVSKDRCFLRAGLRKIVEDPLRAVSLVPQKLAATFDYTGAAGWYLHASNPSAFDDKNKLELGAVETVWQRLLVAFSLFALARAPGRSARARQFLAAASAAFLISQSAWVAYVGLVSIALMLGRALWRHPPAAFAAATVAATALAHAAFFGAGRYSLVCFTLVGALAGAAFARSDTTAAEAGSDGTGSGRRQTSTPRAYPSF